MKKNLSFLILIAASLIFLSVPATFAQQVPLAGKMLPQFVDPLPLLDLTASGTAGIDTLVAGVTEIELHMREFKANVMPTGFAPANGLPYQGTSVFGYINGSPVPAGSRATYTGPVIVATRNLPTQIRFVNNLTANQIFWRYWTDQTLHWADPLNGEDNMCNHMIVPGQPATILDGVDCAGHYLGPIPAVPHLHGGYVPPTLDGGPDGWFTSDGSKHGHGYYTRPGVTVASNEQVLRYPNSQEAAMIWFHDHLLGGTRINVYAGLAGAYPIIDPNLGLPTGMNAVGLNNGNLDLTPVLGTTGANTELLVPLVIQDRMFDVNGELYFPNVGINPEHPYWVPEFMGDTILVNGKVWPFLNVNAKRYRFLMVNGSNARPYELFLDAGKTGTGKSPVIWQIGTDGGYLDAPVAVPGKLVLLPGERAEIIVDFAGFGGKNIVLRNTARAPYPGGAVPDPKTVGTIMQFRVLPGAVTDNSYDPAAGTPIRTGAQQIVRLVDPATGTLNAAVTVTHTRQMTLNEVIGIKTKVGKVLYPGGPLEILVNNTKWSGEQPDGGIRPDFTPITLNGITNYFSELPKEGTTEIWEIINLTADTHPMHTHLIQTQILNRETFDVKGYAAAYAAAFPGSATIIDPATGLPYAPGVYIPGFGPPLDYNTGNLNALGGNPDITPYLSGVKVPPAANEAGWKDTMQAPPGTVTRFVARFAPQGTAADASANFQFDPAALSYNYVWHCHIVDHEDNEMMRPYAVIPAAVERTYVQGVDY
jgi:spore coat protein A